MDKDFTLKKYRNLCISLIESGYKISTIWDYFKIKDITRKLILLRHDVDRKPLNALKTALIEKELGITSTYYFRHTKNVFKPSIIKKIARMGHEIGFHYETLTKAKGNFDLAIKTFEIELKKFRTICNVKTISMHGSPFSRWDNRDLWTHYDFRQFKITAEAYLSIDYHQIAYLTDTGRTWNNPKFNIRDTVKGIKIPPIKDTDELINFLKKSHLKRFCILTHPNRWSESKLEQLKEYLSDTMINYAKLSVKNLKNRK